MARNIKLINADAPDATDIQSLVSTLTAGWRTDREKMIALWAYIARNAFYHWCEARERPEGTTELGMVFDPIAAFNVHGTTICYQVSHLLGNLGELAGIKCRTIGAPGHRLMEAYYDGQWHLFDGQYDLAAYYVADDGETIASYEQVCRAPDKYVRHPKYPSQPFFQFDRCGGEFWPWETREYAIEHFFNPDVPAKATVYRCNLVRGHSIHLDLRRGERLIRRWSNEGKWYCPPEFRQVWKRDLTQRWVDAGPHDPRAPENTYANGELIYEPDWQAADVNFRDGLHDGHNFALVDGEVRPASAGACQVVFRVYSPYLIVGRPAEPPGQAASQDGAVVQADFFRKDETAANSVSVSIDTGLTWRQVWTNDKTGRSTVRLDLTEFVEGTHGYLIRFDLTGGRPEDASLSHLRLRNSLFFSPVPLPAVRPGENRFVFSMQEGHGVLCLQPDLGEGADFRRHFAELKNLTYDPKFVRHLSPRKGRGHAVLAVAAPPAAKIARMTVHACFGVDISPHRRESAEILYAAEPQGPWRSAWKSDFPGRNEKWRWDESVDIVLDAPSERCYLKFVLNRRRRLSLNMVRLYAHYLRPSQPLRPGDVRVVHEWLEDGQRKTHTASPHPAGEAYIVPAGGERIQNLSVTIDVANES